MAGIGIAVAQTGGETVATRTFTHEDVVTYTIPTETVVSTVTVTQPPPPTPPPPRARLHKRGRRGRCLRSRPASPPVMSAVSQGHDTSSSVSSITPTNVTLQSVPGQQAVINGALWLKNTHRPTVRNLTVHGARTNAWASVPTTPPSPGSRWTT